MKTFISLIIISLFLSCSTTNMNSIYNRNNDDTSNNFKYKNQPQYSDSESLAITRPTFHLKKMEEQLNLLSDYLEDEFAKFPEFKLIDRMEITKTLKEIGLNQSGVISENDAVKVGKQIGAKKVLYSKLTKSDNIFIVTCRLVDTETGRVKTGIGRVSSIDLLDGAAKGCARRATGRME